LSQRLAGERIRALRKSVLCLGLSRAQVVARATVEARRPLPSDQPSEEAAAGGIIFPSWYDNSFHEAAWAAVLEIGTTWRWLENSRCIKQTQIPTELLDAT
jgi:hypothetical protein